MAQQSKFGLDHLDVEVTRSYTDRQTYMEGLLLTGDLLIAEATPYTIHTHKKKKPDKQACSQQNSNP